jgi:acetyl esterase/lipase
MKQAHSDVPSVSTEQDSFRGLALVSPWVTFDQTAPAFEANKQKDVLSGPALQKWSDAFMGRAPRSVYNTPLDADPDWWKGVPARSTLLLAGENEIFVDDILTFREKFKVHNDSRLETLIAQGECHDSPYLDYMLRNGGGLQTKRLLEWIVEKA